MCLSLGVIGKESFRSKRDLHVCEKRGRKRKCKQLENLPDSERAAARSLRLIFFPIHVRQFLSEKKATGNGPLVLLLSADFLFFGGEVESIEASTRAVGEFVCFQVLTCGS